MRLPRAFPRSILAGLVLFGALTTTTAAGPMSVFACSCMQPQPIAAYEGDPLQQIFVGTVASTRTPGVDVAVERWFQGGSEAFVRLSPDGFGDQSAACQDPFPPIGSRWIWVAYVDEASRTLGVNLCTPKARLDTPEGAAMLAEAETAFGAGAPIEPTPAPEAPVAPVEPGPPADSGGLIAPAVGVGLAAIVVFGAVGLLARQRARKP